MKNTLLILSTIALAFTACNKDDEPTLKPESETTAFDYLPTTKGSYWVYETYKIDQNGEESKTGEIDSCYVTGDTIIDGVKYIGFYNFSPHEQLKTTYLTEMDGKLKTNHGMVIFDLKNLNSVISTNAHVEHKPPLIVNDTVYTTRRSARKVIAPHTVPAGIFADHIIHSLEMTAHPKYQSNSVPNKVIEETYYSWGVGAIKQQYYYFFSRNNTYEWRLVRYHIAK